MFLLLQDNNQKGIQIFENIMDIGKQQLVAIAGVGNPNANARTAWNVYWQIFEDDMAKIFRKNRFSMN